MLRRLRPETGAVRSYGAGRDDRFIISRWSRHKASSRDSWTLYDRLSGALVKCWNLSEAVAAFRRLTTAPVDGSPRFVVTPRHCSAYDPEDAVLFDRVTGRWWKRVLHPEVFRDIQIMELLAPHLPDAYTDGGSVYLPPVERKRNIRSANG